MYSIEYNNAFISLVATSFGRYDHNPANATQYLKRLVTPSALNCQVVCGPIYINTNIC
jgi:hypothetical protein